MHSFQLTKVFINFAVSLASNLQNIMNSKSFCLKANCQRLKQHLITKAKSIISYKLTY
ncbi:hypothetical protein LguiB_025512 [Lonicera macranthoides]